MMRRDVLILGIARYLRVGTDTVGERRVAFASFTITAPEGA
jgi:hypothetical protein